MHKIYISLLVSIFPLNLFCQEAPMMVKDSAHAFFWNSESNSWIYHVRYLYGYDTKGNLIDNFWYNGMSDDQLLSEYYISYAYDSSGNLTEKIWHDWVSESKNWIYRDRIVYEYDKRGKLIEETTYEWDSESNEWKVYGLWCDLECLGGRKVYNHDSSGSKIEVNWYDWDSDSNNWVKKENWYEMYVYDTNMNLIEECCYNYGCTCTFYQYDEHGNLDIQISSFDTSFLLMDTILYSNIYDEYGNLTEKVMYSLNPESRDTIWLDRDRFVYDANGYRTERYSYSWDSGTRDWHPTWRYIYYWSPLNTSIYKNITDPNFLVYPNPTRGILTIETDITGHYSIAITSLNGQLLYTDRMEGPTHQIDLSSFEKGLYFITIRSRDYLRTEKIIKQ